MSTVEEFERDCPYCREPIRLKWKNGLIPLERYPNGLNRVRIPESVEL